MKVLRTDYTFDASAQTVTFVNAITKEGLLLITNVVAGTIIYSFADPAKGGDIVDDVLTLMYDTTGMIDGNELQVFWDNGTSQLTNTELRATPLGVKFIDDAGTAYGVKHISNKPRVSSMPYLYDIAEGNVTGHTPFSKLGYNANVGATEEDIWTQSTVYPWIGAAGIALEVVSSDGNDTIAGSGIQKVRIGYLDTDYSAQTQILDMNGTTPVPLTDTTILRVNSIRATQVGANGVAAGLITCRLVGGAATIYRAIVAGYTRGRGLTYTVPLGKTLYLTSIAVSSGYTTSGRVVRWTGRAQVDDIAPTVKTNYFQPFFEITTQDNSFVRTFEIPVVIPATADLRVSALSDPATSYCTGALRGWLE
jgi:hypothetical protein